LGIPKRISSPEEKVNNKIAVCIESKNTENSNVDFDDLVDSMKILVKYILTYKRNKRKFRIKYILNFCGSLRVCGG